MANKRFSSLLKYGGVLAATVITRMGFTQAVPFSKQQATLGNAQAVSEVAIFAGGCFWCVEADFDKLPGVLTTESGYIGGRTVNPTYEQVSQGNTGHAEAVRITYDPQQITYPQLLEYFWKHIDPGVQDRQFCDIGNAYRTAIFYLTPEQKQAAEESKLAVEISGRFAKVYTEIVPATVFTVAEEYHQDYYKKNPVRYNFYRRNCGRDGWLAQIWGSRK